ncbi:Uma2 family endonuclease [Actinomadura sp. DC4]|uniref:Uma2 family endonuclease n=1 Tax=Actinomadura sp. DC4 TaxID=3055069 RepID=UPI00339D3CDF
MVEPWPCPSGPVTRRTPTIEEIRQQTPPCPGFQVEIIGGSLVVSPRGNIRHAQINYFLHSAFHDVAQQNGWYLCHELTIHLESNRDRVEPDLVVHQPDAPTFGESEVFGRGVLLVSEVTSQATQSATASPSRVRARSTGWTPPRCAVRPEAGRVRRGRCRHVRSGCGSS